MSFRTERKQEYKEVCDELGIEYSGPFQGFLDFFVDNPEFWAHVSADSPRESTYDAVNRMLEGEMQETYENFGLSTEFYNSLVELVGEYFNELFEGNIGEAEEIRKELYDFNEPVGELVDRASYYLEEEGLI